MCPCRWSWMISSGFSPSSAKVVLIMIRLNTLISRFRSCHTVIRREWLWDQILVAFAQSSSTLFCIWPFVNEAWIWRTQFAPTIFDWSFFHETKLKSKRDCRFSGICISKLWRQYSIHYVRPTVKTPKS